MAVETELYDLLGVQPNATEGEIRKAYMRKAKEHHPDKNINDPEAGQKFQEIAAAYEILNDPQTREVYDMRGMDGLNGPGGSEGMDAADLFAQFFAGAGGASFGFDFGPGAGGPRRSRGKGDDSVIPHEVSLEDLYNGKSVKMNMSKEAVCAPCKGSGARGNAKPRPCATCEGRGWNFVQSQLSPSRIGTSRLACHACAGAGELLKEKDRCKKCKGAKVVTEKTRQEIFIEPGMSDGQRIVLTGAGDEVPGTPAGDVVFVLKLTPHASFERSGKDLLTNVTITLSEALFGFSRILLTHLDGRGIQVSSPRGRIIKPGDSIVLRGEGMPLPKRPDEKGDLYVILAIEMPDEQWLKTVDHKVLGELLPPKRSNPEPRPEIVDIANFEESDIVDVRSRSFPASPNFFDHGFPSQFGDDEENWEDDDDDDEGFPDMRGAQPECRQQ
ncbi:DnaJ-domain-containing protein [Collybia nuda]|uniref:DnaJ-domain-containing protein n=1 Tax=Collybia nuda TaxID=64659 RepID=A0A9P5YC51_9AGAR|nr:DnaJ-domain-containing protein [Collybia nuda]